MKRRFKDKPSETYLNTVRAIEALLESEDLDTANRAYCEATTVAMKEAFSQFRGLTQNHSGHVCTDRLKGKRCPDRVGKPCWSPEIPGQDHIVEWQEGRKTIAITLEPYGMSYSTVKALIGYCEENGFEFDVLAGSWHFTGQTVLIVIRKAE